MEKGRLHVGVDGLMVRTVTAAEKGKRRKAHAARRRSRGRRVGARKAGEAKRRGPDPVPGAIETLAKSARRSSAKREALRRLRGYITQRLNMLD